MMRKRTRFRWIKVVLLVNSVSKGVIRRVGNDGTKSDLQREEALRHGGVPNLSRQKCVPLRPDEVENALAGAGQSNATHEQRDEDDVRKEGREIGLKTTVISCPANLTRLIHYHFAGGGDSFGQSGKDENPAEEETEREAPVRQSDAVVHVGQLSQDVRTGVDQNCNGIETAKNANGLIYLKNCSLLLDRVEVRLRREMLSDEL